VIITIAVFSFSQNQQYDFELGPEVEKRVESHVLGTKLDATVRYKARQCSICFCQETKSVLVPSLCARYAITLRKM
jgi:hypothetical protein